MKNLFFILFAALIATSCSRGRTIAMGQVIFPDSLMVQPYYALVPNLDDDAPDCEPWMRWEPWELQNNYNISARRGQTIHCMWQSRCNGDTLAQLTITGIRGKQKTYADTLLLDGSHYYRGTKNEKR